MILDVRSEPGLCANNNICICAVQDVIQFLFYFTIDWQLTLNSRRGLCLHVDAV